MMIKLNESTAARRRIPVTLVDDTDGKTAETGITISAGDLKISKNGAAQANHSGTLTEIAIGDYYYEAAAGEVDTFGYLTGTLVKPGVRTFRFMVQIVAFDPYDAVRLGLTALPNAVANATGGLGGFVIRGGTAQAGAASTITLDASASSTDDFYNGCKVRIVSGTGAGQERQIVDYVGSTKVATIYSAGPPAQGSQWVTNPDNTSVFEIIPESIVPAPITVSSGIVQAEIIKIAGETLQGAGTSGDPWRPV